MKSFVLAAGLAAFLILSPRLACADYDPLAVGNEAAPTGIDLTVHDAGRKRDIPIRVYLPAQTGAAPVILFSPGLGGDRTGSAYLGQHWAARGYVAVYLQHPGSDDAVWKSVPEPERLMALQRAASLDNFLLRVQDVPVVLDQLAVWNKQADSPLNGRVDLSRVGMSGHSFGAVTTQAVSGESFAGQGPVFFDPRIKAAIAFSPSVPRMGNAERAFATVKIPWMLMTGTKDIAPIGHADLTSRLGVYPNLHNSPKYEVVLDNAEHSAFTDRALPGDAQPRNPNHHRVILALSTAFWDAYIKGDPAALAWLAGPGPRSVKEAEDKWQFEAGPKKY